MYGIASSAVPQGIRTSRPWGICAVYVLAAGTGGAIAGVALGALGATLQPSLRIPLATLAALIGCVLAVQDLRGARPRMLQCNRETPKRWLGRSPTRWAVQNGAALGVGATSRIGFALWYVVPAAALLSGSALAGGALYGGYGLARGLGAPLMLLVAARRGGFDRVAEWALGRLPVARRVAGAHLLAVGVAVSVAVGL